jgi:predicted molibdopterin-dependent oxidoreductase YjgC
MGALPDRLPGFQHVENDELRTKFDRLWGVPIPEARPAPVRASATRWSAASRRSST